ncbi:MAG: TraB/GumN family protein [Gammaproteobacteria bacterium]|nr:TraB/GumN family protein [Gammaproteobacteria bacterium]MDH5651415.1 TraB/GumN family protein [Gammaproteobacteria bacterium]
MQRKLSIYLLSISLLLLPVAVSAAQQQGIVWQISRSGLKPSYLMGTMHSDDERIVKLSDKAEVVFKKADSFTAEMKLDFPTMQAMSSLMFFNDGQDLEKVIGAKRYQICVGYLVEHGLPETMIRSMKPWAVSATLSMPKPKTGLVLDMWLYQRAESDGKRIYGLETPVEQASVFEAFTLQQQISMLDDTLRYYHELPVMLEEMIGHYLRGDLTGLERVGDKYMQQGDPKLAQEMMQRAITDRNHRMVKRMQPRLLEGNSFIAVGALHLPGEEGILRLLEKQGYTVTPVN